MKNHAAYGLEMEDLDVVVVEDSKPMQTIIRSILLSFKVARVRAFDSVDEALQSMLAEPPNVILTDWRMEPASGYQLLRLVRHKHMDPLCFVPILFLTAHGTRALVDRALRAGAHHLLVKPVAPSTLYSRLRWLLTDDRSLVLESTGFYNILGVDQLLDAAAEKIQTLENARTYHQQAIQRLAAVQDIVDKEFERTAVETEEVMIPENPAIGAEARQLQAEAAKVAAQARPIKKVLSKLGAKGAKKAAAKAAKEKLPASAYASTHREPGRRPPNASRG
ncbi:response regulator [Roseibium suaedae]|uniref:Two-component system, chemotaxis family, response regulator CheY n=1 Tax=Roseibium suaedae TaxID=735517 RepID=A0A1M7L597_9HYPH|nr:response regulator [Roseibium suaedae]SHM72982.1 two-component system, chemotaxis family, response regulator CheY [Roseibium suaedae]